MAELAGMLDLAGWPKGMRGIVRRVDQVGLSLAPVNPLDAGFTA
ncbi:hypothetical protein [Actinomadura geliboluensis]|nr:hypothetical protein [Actinomadura geliboluensis]